MSENVPHLLLGPGPVKLSSYRATTLGIYFVQTKEDGTPGDQLNWISAGLILNSAGDHYHDEQISELLAKNIAGSCFTEESQYAPV